jgi:EmrB/QacA subfamily drug resistance transporter
MEDGMNSENDGMGFAAVATVALGTFMCSFDMNAANMALPLIQADFKATVAASEWVAVAYLLTLSATLLAGGRLADMLGHKRLYVAGFAGFAVSSLLCLFSRSILALIFCRVLQGLCASLMMSSSNAIIVDAVPPSKRGKALGFTAVAVALAACAGPSLGGLLAASFGWRAIFLVNVPIGAVGSLLAFRAIKRDGERAAVKFDLLGALLVTAGLLFLLLSLDLLSGGGASLATVCVLAIAGLVVIEVFILHEKRFSQPLLDLGLFKNRVFSAGNFAATLFYLSEFILVFLAPYFLQGMRGLSAGSAGLMMLPMSLALMAVAPLAGALSDRFDSRIACAAGMVLLAVGELSMGGLSAATPAWRLATVFAVIGAGAGLFMTPNNSAVMGSVPADRRGVAGATLGTMRNLGMTLGEAISAALISSSMASRGLSLGEVGAADGRWALAFGGALRACCAVAALAAIAAMALALGRGRRPPVAALLSEPREGL